MCSLCGALGVEPHWTDGARAARRPAEARARLAERRLRVLLANRVLRHYGLGLSDWDGHAYALGTATGSSRMVANIGLLWPAAEALLKRRCDPLDEALLAAIEGA